MSEPRTAHPERGWLGPYVAVLVVGLLIGLGLLAYVAGYANEIIAIVTQSPT